MTRTKQVLSLRNIAACLIVSLPFLHPAQSATQDSTAAAARDKRLVLVPQAHLQLTAEPIWGDSVEAIVTIAVPDSCKNQRYLCRFETSTALRFVTIPRYKWAVRKDSLKVLSAIPLQIRLAQQSFAAPAPAIKIHFQNADHPAGLKGTATLEIISGPQSLPPKPLAPDQDLASKPAADSSPIPPIAAVVDSAATAGGSDSSGILYIVLAIVLIFLFAGLGWLMTWSQRRRFQSIAAKPPAAAFPPQQHLEPAPAQNQNPALNETATAVSEAPEIPQAQAASSNLPAVVAPENQLDLSLVVSQLHELKITLQQIMATQHEVNQRLAQFTAVAALEAPRASAQLALFDILNDETPARNGGSDTDSNGAPHLSLQPAADCGPDRRPDDNKNENAKRSPHPGPASNLRIFFAPAEDRGEAANEILLH